MPSWLDPMMFYLQIEDICYCGAYFITPGGVNDALSAPQLPWARMPDLTNTFTRPHCGAKVLLCLDQAMNSSTSRSRGWGITFPPC